MTQTTTITTNYNKSNINREIVHIRYKYDVGTVHSLEKDIMAMKIYAFQACRQARQKIHERTTVNEWLFILPSSNGHMKQIIYLWSCN